MAFLLRAVAVILWIFTAQSAAGGVLALSTGNGPELMIGVVSLLFAAAAFFGGRFLWRRGAAKGRTGV